MKDPLYEGPPVWESVVPAGLPGWATTALWRDHCPVRRDMPLPKPASRGYGLLTDDN